MRRTRRMRVWWGKRRRGRNRRPFHIPHSRHLSAWQASLVMVLAFPLVALFGMLPFVFLGHVTPVHAFFDSMAAVTTTGLTCVPAEGSGFPPLLIFWHSLLGWGGGFLFLVLLVTVLPQVSGNFGLTLSARQSIRFIPTYRRMAQSMRQVGGLYIALTLAAAAAFLWTGLSPFQALNRAMLTISTTGDGGFGAFLDDENPWLELAAGVVMLVAGGNLLLYWRSWHLRSLRLLLSDMELKRYLVLLLGAGLLLSWTLWHTGTEGGAAAALRHGFFQAVSFLTTTGYVSADTSHFPDFARYILFLLACSGACIGAPSGGLKIMRLIVLSRMSRLELQRTLHPHMVVSVKVDGLVVEMRIVSRILALFFLYIGMLAVGALVLSLAGLDALQAIGLSAGCLTSTGSTAQLFGVYDMGALPAWAQLFSCLWMMLGRIELFSFFVLLAFARSKQRKHW